MSDDQYDKAPSIAKAKIEDLQARLRSTEHADDTTLDPYRDMMHAAHNSSNGNAHKIEALAETVGHIAIVLSQEKLREPERMQTAFAVMHEGACAWPDKKEVAAMIAKMNALSAAPVTEEESFFFGIPKWKLGIGATGKASSVIGSRFVTGLFVLAVVFLYGYIQNRRFTEAVDAKISGLATQALRIANTREENADARAETTREMIRNYEPEALDN